MMTAVASSPDSNDVTGVVLLNMGGPDSLDAVEPFLYNLFNDNDIIPLPLRGFLIQPLLARFISSRRSRSFDASPLRRLTIGTYDSTKESAASLVNAKSFSPPAS